MFVVVSSIDQKPNRCFARKIEFLFLICAFFYDIPLYLNLAMSQCPIDLVEE